MIQESTETNESVNQVKIADVVYITLKHWPWILLSLALCMGAAVLYLMRTTPIYTRSASIVIKDDSKGGTASSELDAFADMGLLQSHSIIIDEVNKLQSPDVMTEVVKRLNLDKNYSVDGEFRREVIYGPTLPINVNMPSLTDNESAELTVKIAKNGTFTISDVMVNDEDVRVIHSAPMKLGSTVSTSAGGIEVVATPYYKPGEEYTIYVNRVPIKNAVTSYCAKLSVEQKSDKGNTINLTVNDASTQRAEDLINTLISVYNENWVQNRNQISVSTSKFINERLGVIESELGNVDQDISSYQSEHLIPDVKAAASMYMTENQEAAARILDLNSRLQMTRYLRSYLNNESNKNNVLPVNSGIGNAAIETYIAEYNTKILQRNQLAANSSDHPIVLDLDAQIASLRSSILSSINNEETTLETQIRNLQGSKNTATAQIASNPTQAKYLLSMERQQKVKESLYLFLLQKREENELSQAFTAYNTQVITRPNGLDSPTQPRRAMILGMAFILGWLIPFGVTYLREISNTKVRGRRDIENLAIPFLGEIPKSTPKKGEDPDTRIVVKQGKRDISNEAFRVFRTNFGFLKAGDNGHSVVMVTSFNPGSGKTFITMNLGVSLAVKGKKVMVIDCDLRRGSTSKYVGSPARGLSNYLVGETDDISEFVQINTIIPGLSVIPCGTLPPNPTELIETERFTNLVNSLREEYDYVLLDCPPIEIVADAAIVEKLVDRTIFVIRAGLFERSMMPELDRIYAEKRFRNMGLVLNGTVAQGSRYGYKYGYGYGYGYGNYSHYASKE